MANSTQLALCLLLLLTPQMYCAFNLADPGQTGVPLNQMTCNPQTILQLTFSSDTVASGFTNLSAGLIVPPISVSPIAPAAPSTSWIVRGGT